MSCFNGEVYLKRCLDSINNQIGLFEIIIINDGSTDGTLSILNSYTFDKKFINIKIISRPNQGFLSSLDEAITHANSNLVARIDQDDMWKSDHLNTLLIEFKSNNNLVLVGSNSTLIDEFDIEIGRTYFSGDHQKVNKYFYKDNPFVHSSIMFKKSAYLKTKRYFNEISNNNELIGDYYLFYQLSKEGDIKIINKNTLYYRVLSNSMSRSIKMASNYSQRLKIMRIIYHNNNKYAFYSKLHQMFVELKIIYLKLR